ncbi:MAG TPA: hypothetical protein VGJ07_05195 [Rugosimonospora sp.]|jgi:hypothetical protein
MTGHGRQVAVRAGVAVALCVAATPARAGVDEFWPRWVYFALGVALTGEFVLRRVALRGDALSGLAGMI